MSDVAIHCAHDAAVALAELKPHPQNPNTHPEPQIALLAKIIREQGWRNPIVVSNRSGYIVKGHGRHAAALSRPAGLPVISTTKSFEMLSGYELAIEFRNRNWAIGDQLQSLRARCCCLETKTKYC